MRMHDFQPHTNALPPSPAAARGEGEGGRQAPRGGGGARPRTQGIRIDRPHGEGGGDCPRGKIQANVMSRFGSAQDEVRVTAAGPPRDVRNAVAHRPEQERTSRNASSGLGALSSLTPRSHARPVRALHGRLPDWWPRITDQLLNGRLRSTTVLSERAPEEVLLAVLWTHPSLPRPCEGPPSVL